MRGYAEFWKIPWQTKVEPNEEHTVFSANNSILPTKDAVIIMSPSGREGAEKIARDHRLTLNSQVTSITLPAGRDVKVSLRTEIQEFSGQHLDPVIRSKDITILSRIHGTDTYLLAIDLVGEYARRVSGGFEDQPSRKFRLATKLPFSYQSIPQFIRDRTFRSPEGAEEITEDKLGPVECLRTIFLASLVLSSGPIPRIAFWKQRKSYALAITHDVETREGLDIGAPGLIAIEQNLGVHSTWNVPSTRYPLPPGSLDLLAQIGEVGAHDTAHDGRLILQSSQKKIQRLKDCKLRLEKLTNREVRGFRSPLLQHSSELAASTAQAGYAYDSSCPSWEILSPTSLHAHGVGTVFPFEIADTLEIPVSLPQDHQLVRVARLKPQAAVEVWIRLSKWIGRLGGACILLVHPDYEFAMKENAKEYQRLLENFVSDPQCDIMTLAEMADWWKHRAGARWMSKDGQLTILNDGSMDLQTELVTSYGSNGFTSERLS